MRIIDAVGSLLLVFICLIAVSGQPEAGRPARVGSSSEVVVKGPQRTGVPSRHRLVAGPGTVTLRIELSASSYSTFVGVKVRNARGEELLSVNTSASSGAPKVETRRFRLTARENLTLEVTSDTNLAECRISHTLSGGGVDTVTPGPAVRPTPGPIARPTPESTMSAPTGAGGMRIGAELTASRTLAAEFAEYSKVQSSSGKLHFRLTTLAPSADKIFWQVSDRRLPQNVDGTDWQNVKSIASGEAPFRGRTTNFTIDFQALLGTATEKPKVVYVRALVLRQGRLIARPSNEVVVTHGASSETAEIKEPERAKGSDVQAQISIVAFKPRVEKGLSCNFILTKVPPAGELRTILKKLGVTQVGQKYSLCPSDYAGLKDRLTASERALLLWQDFLEILKAGYNWLDARYNFIENQLVDGLVAAGINRSWARKAINTFKAVYGLNPSFGDFDESLDHGKEAFAVLVQTTPGIPEDAQGSIVESFNGFVENVRAAANGAGDPNQFFRADPDFAPRPFFALLRVKYNAANGVPASAIGGSRKLRVRVTSGRTVDKSTLNGSFSSGYQEWPPYLLAEKEIEIPDARAGTEIEIPVYVDYEHLRKADEYRWTQGFNSQLPGKVEAGPAVLNVIVNRRYPK